MPGAGVPQAQSSVPIFTPSAKLQLIKLSVEQTMAASSLLTLKQVTKSHFSVSHLTDRSPTLFLLTTRSRKLTVLAVEYFKCTFRKVSIRDVSSWNHLL